MKLLARLLMLGLALAAAPRAVQQGSAAEFLCPPCGAECHFTTYPKAGNCGGCGMKLVPLASVPQVGVLLFSDALLASTLSTLTVFASADVARVFTVADTEEPLRLADTLEVRPQFALGRAPALDVLVIPDGYGLWDDAMVVEWVRTTAEKARAVVAVGRASVVLARAGLLKGERVPADRFLVERGQELAEGLQFDESLAGRRVGQLFLARDAASALDASLAALAEIGGAERARRTAEELGHGWQAEDWSAGAEK